MPGSMGGALWDKTHSNLSTGALNTPEIKSGVNVAAETPKSGPEGPGGSPGGG